MLELLLRHWCVSLTGKTIVFFFFIFVRSLLPCWFVLIFFNSRMDSVRIYVGARGSAYESSGCDKQAAILKGGKRLTFKKKTLAIKTISGLSNVEKNFRFSCCLCRLTLPKVVAIQSARNGVAIKPLHFLSKEQRIEIILEIVFRKKKKESAMTAFSKTESEDLMHVSLIFKLESSTFHKKNKTKKNIVSAHLTWSVSVRALQ